MKPSIGRIVHYVQEKPAHFQQRGDSPKVTVHLPAIITAVWGDACVNLQVFTDGTNSDPANMAQVKWVTSVNLDPSETPAANSWHWPEQV